MNYDDKLIDPQTLMAYVEENRSKSEQIKKVITEMNKHFVNVARLGRESTTFNVRQWKKDGIWDQIQQNLLDSGYEVRITTLDADDRIIIWRKD